MRGTLFLSVFLLFTAACGGSAPGNNINSSNSNSGAVANAGNNPLATKTATPEQTSNDAPTLTPIYKAYCAAMEKKDEAALRKIFSSDTIKFFEEEMRADKIKSLVEFLSDDRASTSYCEVRNEQINGDKGVAEVRTTSYPKGIKIVFVKEGNVWKLTNRSPDLESVKQQSNSNR